MDLSDGSSHTSRREREMGLRFSHVVEYNGRSLRVLRPAPRPWDPSSAVDEAVRDSLGRRRVRYEYIIPLGPNKRPRVAAADADETVGRLLREVRAGDAAQAECAVCLQDYDAEETVREMPVCAHAFHHRCIAEWLARNAVCPLCRRKLPLEEKEDRQEEEQQQREEDEDDEEDENGVRRSWNWIRVPVSAPARRNWW